MVLSTGSLPCCGGDTGAAGGWRGDDTVAQKTRRRWPTGWVDGKFAVRSEPDAHRALESIGVALEVGDRHPVAPGIFDAEVDKRHRAPNQIGMRHAQELVVGCVLSDQVRVQAIEDGTR